MISETWKKELKNELGEEKIQKLMRFMDKEYQENTLYPPKNKVFNVFDIAPKDVKCVILGQDPYHQYGQAMGLAFSVMPGVAIPKSLQNIYKEIKNEYGYDIPDHGCLIKWKDQGVFLLNASLCVKDSCPGSYMEYWQEFTDAAITILNRQDHPIVFMLWGSFAQKKKELITSSLHLVLTAAHPSPLSAHRGFFGCNHFMDCNLFLAQHQIDPIDWRII